MKAETIKAIFTNLLFVIGVILLIFGFINGSQTAVRLATFPEYPLQTYEETRCDMELIMTKPALDGTNVSLSETEIKDQKEKCQKTMAHARRVKKTEDIVSSLTTLIAGAVLVFCFKRFIFR